MGTEIGASNNLKEELINKRNWATIFFKKSTLKMFKLNQMYTQIYKDKLLFSYQSKCKCCYETFITFTQYMSN